MKRLLAGTAVAMTLASGSIAEAAVQMGVLPSGEFRFFAPIGDTRPQRITFESDAWPLSGLQLVTHRIGWLEEPMISKPGLPPQIWISSHAFEREHLPEITSTGYSFVVDADDNPHCNPYAWVVCHHEEIIRIHIQGANLGDPAGYTYRITAIPEPSTWALAIAGFGFAGALLRLKAGPSGTGPVS